MKTILALLGLFIALSVSAQVPFTPEITGLTTEIHDVASDVIYTKKVLTTVEVVSSTSTTIKNGVKTTSSKLVMRYKQPLVYNEEIGALNLLSIYRNNNGFTEQLSNDTSIIMFKSPKTWNGIYSGWSSAYVSKSGANRYLTVRSQLDSLYAIIGGKAKYFKRTQIDSLSRIYLKLTVEQLEQKIGTVYMGKVYDPAVYLTSYFPYFTVDGGQLHNLSFVNGKYYKSVNSWNLKYANGNIWAGFNYTYLLYNGCGQTSAGDGEGNWGYCLKSSVFQNNDAGADAPSIWSGLAPSYDATTNTFTYSSSRSQAVIGLNMGNTNNSSGLGGYRIYFDLVTGEYKFDL